MKNVSKSVQREVNIIKSRDNSVSDSISTVDQVKIGIALVLIIALGVLIGMYGESF